MNLRNRSIIFDLTSICGSVHSPRAARCPVPNHHRDPKHDCQAPSFQFSRGWAPPPGLSHTALLLNTRYSLANFHPTCFRSLINILLCPIFFCVFANTEQLGSHAPSILLSVIRRCPWWCGAEGRDLQRVDLLERPDVQVQT